METIVVGVADCKVSANPDSRLVTYALGSCIAVAIHDPWSRVAGLLHFMLPESGGDANRGAAMPYRYADTGTPLLFREAYRLGADKHRLVVKLVGGATVSDDSGVFNIGKRNLAAVRKLLWNAGVMVHAEEVGGTQSRTVRMDVATGRLVVNGPSGKERELAAQKVWQGVSKCQLDC
ncbi:MAG: chemotaxis protein CheD [Bryobacterales bacterium]|nr:chemotaxis protein CheD [Bryobacterales bacterium]